MLLVMLPSLLAMPASWLASSVWLPELPADVELPACDALLLDSGLPIRTPSVIELAATAWLPDDPGCPGASVVVEMRLPDGVLLLTTAGFLRLWPLLLPEERYKPLPLEHPSQDVQKVQSLNKQEHIYRLNCRHSCECRTVNIQKAFVNTGKKTYRKQFRMREYRRTGSSSE